MYCLCVNVYCHRVTTQVQLINISFPVFYLDCALTRSSTTDHDGSAGNGRDNSSVCALFNLSCDTDGP